MKKYQKNVLLIVLDSITNDIIFDENCSSKVPFIKYLRSKSISGNNMFSEAPYTEAALKSLLGSVDTMDCGGYIEKYRYTYLVTQAFSDAGYHVFSNAFYPNIYPTYSTKGVNTKKYFEGYNFEAVWEYRFKYYKTLFLEGKTTDDENKMLFEILNDNFKHWILYLEKLKSNDIETSLINDCVNKENIDIDLEKIKKESSTFNKNKFDYMRKLMIEEKTHILFNINNYAYETKFHNEKFRTYFINNVSKTLKKIRRLDFKYNLKNNRICIKQMLKLIKCGDYNAIHGILSSYKNSLIDCDLYKRCNTKFDLFKAQRSFKFISRKFTEWLDENDKYPWFAYIHVDDAHYPESFLSYDIPEKENLDLEISNINKYIKTLSKNFRGSIAYDLALLYCDSVIEQIYKFLDQKNILNNTMIVITADHGYSYSFSPLREKYVLTNYKENYNVPFIVYNHKDCKMIDGFRTTKDIPATLLDMVDIKIPKSFKGHSLLKDYNQDYVSIEYMGGGCPDISRRPINLGIRTKNYLVVMDVYLYEEFTKSKIKEVYDLNKDKYERFNICDVIDETKIKYEKDLIYNRYIELKKEYHYD